MFYAYVLYSEAHNRLYKGSCEDLTVRLTLHNGGKVRSTRPYRPWRLLYAEAFESRSQAFARERFWKSATGARALRALPELRHISGSSARQATAAPVYE